MDVECLAFVYELCIQIFVAALNTGGELLSHYINVVCAIDYWSYVTRKNPWTLRAKKRIPIESLHFDIVR